MRSGRPDAQVSLFTSLFPDLMPRFRAAAAIKAQTCATAKANAVATGSLKGASPQSAAAASDKVRYTTISSFPPAAAPATASTTALKTTYIQIAYECQRGQALALQQALTAANYNCSGIQLVKAAPGSAELRIYRDDEAGAADQAADVIVATLRTGKPTIRFLQTSYAYLPAGVAECWFPVVHAG